MLHLIACSSGKLDRPAPARDLYTSDLFRKSVAYVESIGAPWVVLSALHGVVKPDTVIEPYDVTLLSMSRKERLFWGEVTGDALWKVCGGPYASGGWDFPDTPEPIIDDKDFVFLAGTTYREPMMAAQIWRMRGYHATAPMAGLGIGEQKAWLLANTVRRAAA